ncbi:MAG TPA: hypothetical protein VE262_04925 [Blastocatellia bacterium]|nr:hypothetical protein [Blastocatellia bacterium]
MLGAGAAEGRPSDRGKVEEVERYLPEGSKLHFYEPGARAALVEADLNGDEAKEIVTVHTSRAPDEGDWMPPLTLSVLTRSGTIFCCKTPSASRPGCSRSLTWTRARRSSPPAT